MESHYIPGRGARLPMSGFSGSLKLTADNRRRDAFTSLHPSHDRSGSYLAMMRNCAGSVEWLFNHNAMYHYRIIEHENIAC